MFIEVEGILRRQIKVLVDLFEFNRTFVILVKFSVKSSKGLNDFKISFQMSVIPSVQPFHAIAYPLDPMLALEIR